MHVGIACHAGFGMLPGEDMDGGVLQAVIAPNA